MFDKLKFNNLVISNKKGIQKSRTQTINKLVRKIRKLKTLLEKHPEDMKCKERIRKSTETMEIIKKLKTMVIMKKLLLMDKPVAAIISNGKSVPEEIAVALLSMNKVMQCLVKKFKAELKIIELKSDDWKQALMEPSKRKSKMERTEEKRRRRLELKQQKAMGRKRQEWLEENQTKIETPCLPMEANTSNSTVGNWHEEELSNNVDGEDGEALNDQTRKSETKIDEKQLINKTLVPNKKQKNMNTETLNSALTDTIEQKRVIPELNRISENHETNDSIEGENENPLVVDPFFITDTGENYLSTAIEKTECVSEEESNNRSEFGRKRSELNDKNQKWQQNKNIWASQDMHRKKDFKKHNRNEHFSHKEFTDKQRGIYKKDFTNNNDKKSLHPSWAAKQKLKPIITEFKGKKTTFDSGLNITSTHSENDAKTRIKSNHSENATLHPSWVAKQKLKPTITTFQGKKITFGDDE